MKFPGKRPKNLGIKKGRLAPCPNKPNCVSSQANDRKHQVAPFSGGPDKSSAMQKLKAIVQGMPRVTIVEATADYLYAEFATKTLGFVDDVEFFHDGTKIQVRSASRLGYSDMGVNRKRVEMIRAELAS
jgi:uncharacterized protein (DUF1499 family)